MRALLISACLAAATASATVTVDPASYPAVVEAGVEFGPVRVIVTDASGNRVPNASVSWRKSPYFTTITTVDPSFRICMFDPLGGCAISANAEGVATLPPMFAIGGTEASLRIEAVPHGFATLQVGVVPYSRPDSLTVVSGDNQRVIATAELAERIVVRAADFDGRPLAGQQVTFSCCQYPQEAGGNFADYGAAVTDAQGLATAPAFVTRRGLGEGRILIYMPMPGTHNTAFGTARFTATMPDGRTSLALQDLWWGGASENGWGLSVTQHDDRLFVVLFVYDANGLPTWKVLPAGQWNSGLRYSNFYGDWYAPRGAPYFAYDASRLQVTPTLVGTINFNGDIAGELVTWVGTQARTKRIERQDFTGVAPSPITGLGDMWWGGLSQNGWGIAILEQFGGLFSVWFTYDAQGAPTWFVMPDGRWTGNDSYEGTIYQTRSSSWPDYDARRLQVFAVGTYRYVFAGTGNATFEYRVGDQSGTMPLVRQDF